MGMEQLNRTGSGFLTEGEAGVLLDALLDSDALELQILPEQEGNKTLVRMPYMMNDAVEYYLEFQECTIRGEWDAKDSTDSFSFVENGSSRGLILRQLSGNMVTIWYRRIFRMAQCCQYHRIGHMWRKIPGEEKIRRLVNLLCVIHDKSTYLSVGFSNEKERELAPLAEFGPLRYFTPINESILEWYPESEEGFRAMLRLCERAGNESFRKLVRKYGEDLLTGKRMDKKIASLAGKLLQKAQEDIWKTLEQEITEASLGWNARDYGQERNLQNDADRERVTERYRALGYTGSYPVLEKNSGRKREIVEFVEEQPFTVLEYEDYTFRIFSMRYAEDQMHSIEMKKEP